MSDGKGLRAFRLTQGMAQVVDLNLWEMLGDNSLPPSDLQKIIDRCKDCQTPERCIGWLALHASEDKVADFCANGDTFTQMQSDEAVKGSAP